MSDFRIGLIGTGRISDVYLKNCAAFGGLEIVACGSLNMEESRAKAAEFGVPRVAEPDEIIADPDRRDSEPDHSGSPCRCQYRGT